MYVTIKPSCMLVVVQLLSKPVNFCSHIVYLIDLPVKFKSYGSLDGMHRIQETGIHNEEM